mmetsp:Transcript_42886/g.126075  ORF Transcript_42886/g.126075 Transcript_42886/m.126075 type:complete len:105 (-) Transcript_42886:62-376(-)
MWQTTAGPVGRVDMGPSAPGCSRIVARLSDTTATSGANFANLTRSWADHASSSGARSFREWSDRACGSTEAMALHFAVQERVSCSSHALTCAAGCAGEEQDLHE